MKKLSILSFLVFCFIFVSCEKDTDDNFVNVAVPITQSIADFRASVEVEEPKDIQKSGKIYAWNDYIFINDRKQGVHIINNKDPYHPHKIKFIKIPMNMDIAIKNSKLYADSGMDLVVFDISDLTSISEIARIKDVFPNDYYSNVPVGAAYVEYSNFDPSREVVVGYVIERKKIDTYRDGWVSFDNSNFATLAEGGNTGTGGSMARFSIKGNYLYVADEAKLSAFDIANPSTPNLLSSEYAGWNIETLFNYEDHLYLGSDRGMYIYSIEDPTKPRSVSYLEHVLGCDPVVVKDNHAYVTIRGGNECGQDFNQLDVVDISNKEIPFIANTYEMHNPFGLGVKDDWLFVCDGSAGLKVYDIQNTPDLRLIDQFTNISTFDVIPLEEKLLMVGDNILYQYSYKGDEINLLSSFSLN